MKIHPIRSEDDYRRTLSRIDEIIDAPYGSADADELQVLGTLVDVYENEHHPVLPPHPIEAILARMEELGMTRKALETILGGRSRVSEIFNRRRALSLQMIRVLTRRLKVPADVLLTPYRLSQKKTGARRGNRAQA